MIQKKLLVEKFPGRTLKDIWYNLKLSFKMLKTFFWDIWWFRGYDYSHTLNLLKKAIEVQRDSHKKSFIIENQKVKTLKEMNRAIELLNNILEDNYSERCGYDHNYKTTFEPEDELDKDGKPLFYRIVSHESEEQKKNNQKAIEKATYLEEKEIDELFDILKFKIKTWWN